MPSKKQTKATPPSSSDDESETTTCKQVLADLTEIAYNKYTTTQVVPTLRVELRRYVKKGGNVKDITEEELYDMFPKMSSSMKDIEFAKVGGTGGRGGAARGGDKTDEQKNRDREEKDIAFIKKFGDKKFDDNFKLYGCIAWTNRGETNCFTHCGKDTGSEKGKKRNTPLCSKCINRPMMAKTKSRYESTVRKGSTSHKQFMMDVRAECTESRLRQLEIRRKRLGDGGSSGKGGRKNPLPKNSKDGGTEVKSKKQISVLPYKGPMDGIPDFAKDKKIYYRTDDLSNAIIALDETAKQNMKKVVLGAADDKKSKIRSPTKREFKIILKGKMPMKGPLMEGLKEKYKIDDDDSEASDSDSNSGSDSDSSSGSDSDSSSSEDEKKKNGGKGGKKKPEPKKDGKKKKKEESSSEESDSDSSSGSDSDSSSDEDDKKKKGGKSKGSKKSEKKKKEESSSEESESESESESDDDDDLKKKKSKKVKEDKKDESSEESDSDSESEDEKKEEPKKEDKKKKEELKKEESDSESESKKTPRSNLKQPSSEGKKTLSKSSNKIKPDIPKKEEVVVDKPKEQVVEERPKGETVEEEKPKGVEKPKEEKKGESSSESSSDEEEEEKPKQIVKKKVPAKTVGKKKPANKKIKEIAEAESSDSSSDSD